MFITIPSALVFDLIEHPYFQRLRYIKQLGMTHLVYPGALLERAKPFLPVNALITLDLPTFDRPRNATSGTLPVRAAEGNWSAAKAERRN